MKLLQQTIMTLLRRGFLALFLIFLVLSALVLIDMALGGEEATPGAFIGMLMITTFFAIPYFVLFRKSRTNSTLEQSRSARDASEKPTPDQGNITYLKHRKCSNCNSSQIKPFRSGYRCEHCGSIYE